MRLGRALRNAFLSRGFLLFGPRFSRDYLRFAAHAARRWGHSGPGVAELLGYRVAYPNQSYALFLLHEIFVNATYAFAARRGRPLVIDCGANIGLSVLFFKAYAPDATVVAIEPEPATFEQLRQTVSLNGLRNVELLRAAVSATAGMLPFYSHPDDRGAITASLHAQWGGADAQPVPSIRLSSLVDKPVDFLKLDVEGAEYGVVDDLVESGSIQWIRETVVEAHELDDRPGARDRLIAQLRDAGMRVRVVAGARGHRTDIIHGRRSGVQFSPNRAPSTSRTTSA